MSKLFIVRGLPGSGKSTLAKRLAELLNAEHWEADMYFVKDGVYTFDGSKIGEAHDWCISNVQDAMHNNVDVIVSNTFTRYFEMEDYLDTATELGVEIIFIQCTANYGSIHSVPETTMQKMRDRWWTNDQIKQQIMIFLNSDELLKISYFNAEDFGICVACKEPITSFHNINGCPANNQVAVA